MEEELELELAKEWFRKMLRFYNLRAAKAIRDGNFVARIKNAMSKESTWQSVAHDLMPCTGPVSDDHLDCDTCDSRGLFCFVDERTVDAVRKRKEEAWHAVADEPINNQGYEYWLAQAEEEEHGFDTPALVDTATKLILGKSDKYLPS